ncbi:Cof-type HAD-IIB family hydrolase [Mycoplasma putrefaciens]|uniref:HAD-superfamily hydrolase n=1 Tax=Mycoplasma putrefaciens (strain ATCC 15718 / NCTC 10155 / C30 KS-1 / KS-1) TaxID=743965 RepID=A0A7U4E9V7_MYCPK|nr:Cof-type HAD-IIB family hydrolase [Mycoplasma putrefaciens]AEM69055.1 HAD-superfamily hydrolase [Mycoplasma putrefaciens KS1]
MPKYLFSDFDGTLRNHKNKNSLDIDPKDLEFIKDFQKDNKLVIATGRPYKQIKKYLIENYNLFADYFIVNTGAAVYDNNDNVLYKMIIPTEIKNKIIGFLKTIQDQIEALAFTTEYQEAFLFHKTITPEVKKFFLNIDVYQQDLNFLLDKDLLCFKIQTDQQTWDRIEDFLIKNNFKVNITKNSIKNKLFNEIHAFDVSKGAAIKGLQNQLNILDENIIVVGDDYNDLSMFEMYYQNSYICKQEHNKQFRNKARYSIDFISQIKYK